MNFVSDRQDTLTACNFGPRNLTVLLQNLTIEGYRSFEKYKLDRIARVNLFVGDNNCGKTSVLEAIHILIAQGKMDCTFEALGYREAFKAGTMQPNGKMQGHPDALSMFYARPAIDRMTPSKFTIQEGGNHGRKVEVSVQSNADRTPSLLVASAFLGNTPYRTQTVHLNEGGLASGPILPASKPVADDSWHIPKHVFVPCHGLKTSRLASLWTRLLPNKLESVAVRCLNVIDDKIDSIQFSPMTMSRSDIWVDRESERLRIADLGEGAAFLLSIGVALGNCDRGILFIDEIDTGLYYSKLPAMWKMVMSSAKSLDAQIFATTHSLDCIRALAETVKLDPSIADDIAVFRVDRTKNEAVRFAGNELPIVIEHGIEVR